MSTQKKPPITIGEPTVAIEKTEALHDGWVASGHVTFPLDSARTNGTILEFSFKDAASKHEALHQSLSEVEALIEALSATVERLRQEPLAG